MDEAKANPEKRLFISLITRDISLADAIVDLTDNSVNAAMRPLRNQFSSTADFHRIFANKQISPKVSINVSVDRDSVVVTDDAEGIDFESAKEEVFRFGHSTQHQNARDRLSVYGIGMKRALFKIGDRVSITSNHKSGGFDLKLDVERWADDDKVPWTFPIQKRSPSAHGTGTKITIEKLHDEIRRRITDGLFETELREKLSKVYSFFIDRVVTISVNGKSVMATEFQIGANFSHDKFKSDGVDCTITAGIASATGDKFLADAAGWFVFCNFRTVIYADKSPLTGWGTTLPIFQPKHRPFVGMVSFTSSNPEALPWTTTKGSVNVDDLAWQEAKARMVTAAKPILRVLDSRYSQEGTEIEPMRISQLSGRSTNVFEAAASNQRAFTVIKKEAPKDVKVQYTVKLSEIERVRKHFARSKMSASEIGRKTFEFFLRNEVGGGEK
jgi:Histidine kinase-, DNA gyrase B-, and HSP90-like ATPase